MMGDLENRIRVVEAQLDKIGKYQSQRIKGRHVFISDCVTLARTQKECGTKTHSSDYAIRIVQKHANIWNNMSDKRRALYDSDAVFMVDRKLQERSARRYELQVQLESLQRTASAARLDRAPCAQSSCRWSEDTRQQLQKFFASASVTWNQGSVMALMQEALEELGPPRDAELHLLASMSVWRESRKAAPQPWHSFLCFHRDSLGSCILKYVRDDGNVLAHYRFIFALRKPVFFACLPIERHRGRMSDIPGGNGLVGWTECFKATGAGVIFSTGGSSHFASPEHLWVLQESTILEGR